MSRAENHKQYNYNQDRWPNDMNTSTGKDSNSLGTAAIVFIAIGGVTVIIVVFVCIVLWIRSSRRKPDYRAPTQVAGRAIQRPSFLPFRSFRSHNEPVIIYYPSPDASSINYPIQTPYTFPSTLTLTSQTGSPKPIRSKIFTNPKPSRATVA